MHGPSARCSRPPSRGFVRPAGTAPRGSIAFTRKLLGKTLPFGLLAAAAMFLAVPVIPHLLGRSFANSVPALKWLCLLPVFRSLHLGAGDTLTGAGYQRYRTAAQLSAAGLNFGLNLWLIPAYSWHGAAWASLCSPMAAWPLATGSSSGG